MDAMYLNLMFINPRPPVGADAKGARSTRPSLTPPCKKSWIRACCLPPHRQVGWGKQGGRRRWSYCLPPHRQVGRGKQGGRRRWSYCLPPHRQVGWGKQGGRRRWSYCLLPHRQVGRGRQGGRQGGSVGHTACHHTGR